MTCHLDKHKWGDIRMTGREMDAVVYDIENENI
jgi:hypothetical protein